MLSKLLRRVISCPRKATIPGLATLPVLGCLLAPAMSAQVVINEVMADNRSTLPNEDTFPDWVELLNTSAATVNLQGWSLTDNENQPAKFVFPAGVTLPPGGTMLVYLDDETSLPGLHAGFGLNSLGELLALYDAPANGGARRDRVVFGLQVPDFSIGRAPDGSGPFALNRPTPLEFNEAAPLATSANLFINEWMADDAPREDWLELYNAGEDPAAIGGLVFTDDNGPPGNRAIPALSFIGAEGFIKFFADNLAETDANHLDFRLSAGGETITLYQADRTTVVNRVTYGTQSAGVSQGRLPDGGPDFEFFPAGRNTPGSSNFLPLTDVLVNEVLAHTDPPLEDAIELINVTGVPIDISHWWISDSRNDLKKFQVPAGTVMPAGGFKVFYEYQFNPDFTGNPPSFSFNSARGDDVFLASADATGRFTGFRGSLAFGASQNGVSFGRHTNSQGVIEFIPMSRLSFGFDNPVIVQQFRLGLGQTNPAPRTGPLMIYEIMYHPREAPGESDNTLDEYIEIFNASNATVLLYDPAFSTNTWRLTGGVTFDFPRFTGLGGGQSLVVVNFNPQSNPAQLAAFRSRYGVPGSVQVFGPYQGRLDNRGEALELYRPDTPQPPGRPDAGLVPYLLVDRVVYEDRAPWPSEPDGSGMALERLGPEFYGNDPAHWRSAAPTPGWQEFRIEAVERRGNALALRFRALAGLGYTVQYKTVLGPGLWFRVADLPPQATTAVREVTDPALTTDGRRFYRVVFPPQ